MIRSKQSSERIAIVDDDKDVRDGYAYAIEGDGYIPVDQPGPLGSLDTFLAREMDVSGAVSDYRLTPAGYAQFDGARLVASWYQRNFPAVLCTTFGKSSADHFRSYRRWVPVVMSPEELSPETVREGLSLVRNELQGNFVPVRRPWRALVHFIDYVEENRSLYVKLPGWGSDAVALRLADLPPELGTVVTSRSDFRCYAQANLGTESTDDLYLSDWEI